MTLPWRIEKNPASSRWIRRETFCTCNSRVEWGVGETTQDTPPEKYWWFYGLAIWRLTRRDIYGGMTKRDVAVYWVFVDNASTSEKHWDRSYEEVPKSYTNMSTIYTPPPDTRRGGRIGGQRKESVPSAQGVKFLSRSCCHFSRNRGENSPGGLITIA